MSKTWLRSNISEDDLKQLRLLDMHKHR